MNAWDDFWKWADTSALGATIVGGLIVAAIVGVLAFIISRVPKWRVPVFGGIKRFFRWITSVRITTRGRLEELRNAPTAAEARLLEKHLRKIAELKSDHQIEILKIEKQWKDKDQKRMEESSTAWQQIEQKRFGEGRKQGLKDAVALPAWPDQDAPVMPKPKPRWRIYDYPDGDGHDYVLRNSVPRSVAREVRLEAPSHLFDIHDAAHWEDVSGDTVVDFRGLRSEGGETFGVPFEIAWHDEHGASQMEVVRLRPVEDAQPPF